MLIKVVESLRGLGIEVRQLDGINSASANMRADAVLALEIDGATSRFAIDEKARAPYPNEIAGLDGLRVALSQIANPMLVAPFISEGVGEQLRKRGWSWADSLGNVDVRAPGVVVRQRIPNATIRDVGAALPKGSGSLAVIRALIRFGEGEHEDFGATALAAQAGVSQPRASQVLRALHALGLVVPVEARRWRPNREGLLSRFLDEYQGPGGSERFLYSLDPLVEIARRVARAVAPRPVSVSGDVAADLLVSWRRPSVLILYTSVELEPEQFGLVKAQGSHDANVILRRPRDASVHRRPPLVVEINDQEVTLADEAQILWDQLALGGADRREGAEMFKRWLLANPQ